MAEAALRGRAPVRPSSGCEPAIQRKCAACEEKEQGKIARRATGGAPAATQSAPLVRDVVQSPGQPLLGETRSVFESRFGYDFSHVRVHADAQAATSARAVNAFAFTYGNHVVFDSGRYRPDSAEGQRLLAHELAHVVQQDTAPSRPKVARYVPAAVYAEAPPQVITLPSQGVTSPGMAGPALRYAPPPTGSLADIQQRIQSASDVAEAKLLAELPMATLEVGGADPDFIFTKGTRTQTLATDYQPWPSFTYRVRYFSVLDAIDYDVKKVNTENQLKAVYSTYFPDTMYTKWGLASTGPTSYYAQLNLGSVSTVLGKLSFEDRPVYKPKSFDPGAVGRTAVFLAAARERAKAVPQLTGWELFKQIAKSDLDVTIQNKPKAGPCQEGSRPRAGSHPDHDAYATHVTGSADDYWIRTPEGLECNTDGRDVNDPRRLWEVKTGHEMFGATVQTGGALYAPYVQNRLYRLEAQRERCSAAARRCGYNYAFAFDVESVADYVRQVWGNNPPVHYRARP